jgi:hypothetical protein
MSVKLVLKNRKNGGARQTEWVLGNGIVLHQARQTDRTMTDRQKVAGFAILISAAENIGALNNVTAGTEQWNEAQRLMISNVLRI